MHDDLFVIFEDLVLGTPRPVLAGFFIILASLILTWIKQGADERERRRRYHIPLSRRQACPSHASGTRRHLTHLIMPQHAVSIR
jgi:hypothetical protein